MYVKDLTGKAYPCQLTHTVNIELNGNIVLNGTFYPSKVNKLFMDDLTEMWTITDFDDVKYKIIYARKRGEGMALTVDIRAIPLFFDELDTSRIYEEYNEHMTANVAFGRVFEGTNFTYALVDSFDAVQWEGFGAGGSESKLETFKRCLERYQAEFKIVGHIVYLYKLVGRDTQFQYRHRLNASNIVKEIDATALYTYAKGYGNYQDGDDWQDAKLIREYTSPIARIIGIRHAPPIKDGRVTSAGTMDRSLKALVDESLKISISANIHDLRKQGYPLAQPEVGDRVFVIDERIDLLEEVRVTNITIMKNWKNEVIELNVTFGSEGVTKRHQSNLNTAIKDFTAIMSGKKKIPMTAYDNAVIVASESLKRMTSELVIPENGGLMAVDKNNPNNVVLFNAAGIGVSTDGGATFGQAMTGQGINASYIAAGTLDVGNVLIRGGSATEYSIMQGSTIELRGTYERTWRGNSTNHDVKTRLHKGHLRFRNENLERSLYLSEYGMSTYLDGEGELGGSSGSIIWWDTEYSPTGQKGITVNSWGGTVALVSDRHHALVKSRYSTTIESTESNISLATHTDEANSGSVWTFTKSVDRREGYILYGKDVTKGFRFGFHNNPIIQVVDENNQTGGSTAIEAGFGIFNTIRPRDSSEYINLASADHFRVGTVSSGNVVRSNAILGRTYSAGANMHITENGVIGISTSASKYKNAIENQFKTKEEQLKHSLKILKLNPKTWFDDFECEILASEIETGEKHKEESFELKRHFGLIAEDVESVGLKENVTYDINGDINGISHDKLWIHLIPIIKVMWEELFGEEIKEVI